MLRDYLPTSVNTGPWATSYTLFELRKRPDVEFVLPICSLATPYQLLAELGQGDRGPLLLPPLLREALDDELRGAIVDRITHCFPEYGGPNASRLRVIELPAVDLPAVPTDKLIAFSVDTAVEEHGPHLPLATDTIQSYSVLDQLDHEMDQLELVFPLEYGQLTWGLPFGFSVDLTADLVSEYVSRYVDAIARWRKPRGIYVVDVHGSITHRSAIVEGLKRSGFGNWTFRWLHEPLASVASARGDQHAGGVETALVQRVSDELLDPAWWQSRIDEIAAGQMSFDKAVELTPDLDAFSKYVEQHSLNGVIGDIMNYRHVDAEEMFQSMLTLARRDVEALLSGRATQTAGEDLW